MHKLHVLIGRFQAPSVHLGYVNLIHQIDAKRKRGDQLIVLLGVANKMADAHDPLDFESRRDMLFADETLARLKDFEIYGLYDCQSNRAWSEQIDNILRTVSTKREFEAMLYGGRNNSLACYNGVHPTLELVNHDGYGGINSTTMRAAVEYENSAAFRRGQIYAANQRFPVSFQAVDMAVFRQENGQSYVLLGQKHNDNEWRLPGGFVDPADESLEAAARRELREECGVNLEVSKPEYAGSLRINDWRYRSSENAVMSAVYTFVHVFGGPKAGDDLRVVGWFEVDSALETIAELHKPALQMAWTKYQEAMDL